MDDQSASCMESRSRLPGLHLFQGVCQFKEDAADSQRLSIHPLFNRCVVVDFLVLSKILMALSSVGLYSAIQMEVKAVTVQRPRSTSQLERFVLINAENEAPKRTPEYMQGFFFFFVPLTNAQNLSPRSHKWVVILVDSTEM